MELVSWLEQSSGSVALRQSLYAYPVVETLHVVALALFVGLVAVVDLRLLGVALTGTPAPRVAERLFRPTMAGFFVVASTGLLLFYANPERSFHSVWLRAKLLFLLLGLLNAASFYRARAENPRSVAWVSLVCWAAVIVSGRLIAYHWFDCDRAPGAFAAWFAGCPGGAP